MTLQSDRLIGQCLGGRYTIVSEVGKGRSGVVYKAQDATLSRTVALKVMWEHMGEANALERFKREAMAAGALNHPNIVTVFDFGLSQDNYAFLALEFLEGADLQTVVTKEGKIELARSVRIVSQVCLALGHAHKRGLVHRDLKPSNIVLRDLEEFEDFVKIVDFGIAKRFDVSEETNERLTLEGQVLGTPAYMSPEQCQATRTIDSRSDIYSLGCVLYRMVTGVPPVSGASLLDVINGHLSRPPLDFAEVPGGVQVPSDVQRVILRALSKRPEDRPQSMFEFRLALNAAFANSLDAAPRAVLAGRNPTPADGLVRINAGPTDAQSQYELAVRLESGEGVTANLDESRRWMRSAAERGHREAQYRVGVHLMAPPLSDLEQGMDWLRKSAQQGYDAAQFTIGQCFETGNGVVANLPQAISWFQEAARQGHKDAEAHLAACYLRCSEAGEASEGMETWLRDRAIGGAPAALLALADYLRKQPDPGKHYQEILQLYTEAAHRGELEAQLVLARDLMHSPNTELQKQAYHWANTAAQRSDPDGVLLKAVALKNGCGTPADPAQAFAHLEQAAEKGLVEAQTLVACSLMLGESTNRNLTRGIAMLKAAAATNSFAQWKLALCCKHGLGTTRDTREAERLFKLAAEGRFVQGPHWPFATTTLSFEDAVQSFQALAALDNKLAYHWLGMCCEDGMGTVRDPNRALQYYSKAAQKGHPPAQEAVARLRGAARV